MDPAPTKPPRRDIGTRITPELSRKYAALRRAKAQALALRDADVKPAISPINAESAAFLAQRLSRVRAQLSRIDRMMELETDPAKLDRLASAQSRLAEQERLLDDRSLPGSRRPAPEAPVSGIGAMMAARRQQPPPADGERRDQK